MQLRLAMTVAALLVLIQAAPAWADSMFFFIGPQIGYSYAPEVEGEAAVKQTGLVLGGTAKAMSAWRIGLGATTTEQYLLENSDGSEDGSEIKTRAWTVDLMINLLGREGFDSKTALYLSPSIGRARTWGKVYYSDTEEYSIDHEYTVAGGGIGWMSVAEDMSAGIAVDIRYLFPLEDEYGFEKFFQACVAVGLGF